MEAIDQFQRCRIKIEEDLRWYKRANYIRSLGKRSKDLKLTVKNIGAENSNFGAKKKTYERDKEWEFIVNVKDCRTEKTLRWRKEEIINKLLQTKYD